MPSKKPPPSKYVCVVSDATGGTAKRVVGATLAQFRSVPVEVDVLSEIKTVEQAREAVRRTASRGGLIAYTLVDPALREEIVTRANEERVISVDLIGPLMTSLSQYLTVAPAHLPGLYSQPGDEHYERLEAVSFTVRHDDGLSIQDAALADIVIVGPSRTSKTPLSVYLAHTRGLKVANVPVALGMPPVDELRRLGPRQVVGLTMRADILSQVRRQRLKEMGNPEIEYAEIDYVERELRHCHEVYRSPPAWPVIDVTGKSIEEIAAEVCSITVDSPDYLRGASP